MWVNHMGALKELWQQIEANVLPKSYYYNYHCDYNNNLYIFIIHNQLLAAINPDQIIHFSHKLYTVLDILISVWIFFGVVLFIFISDKRFWTKRIRLLSQITTTRDQIINTAQQGIVP